MNNAAVNIYYMSLCGIRFLGGGLLLVLLGVELQGYMINFCLTLWHTFSSVLYHFIFHQPCMGVSSFSLRSVIHWSFWFSTSFWNNNLFIIYSAYIFDLSPLCSFPIAYKHAEAYSVIDLSPASFFCISLLYVIHSFLPLHTCLIRNCLLLFFSILSSSISFICPLFLLCQKNLHMNSVNKL